MRSRLLEHPISGQNFGQDIDPPTRRSETSLGDVGATTPPHHHTTTGSPAHRHGSCKPRNAETGAPMARSTKGQLEPYRRKRDFTRTPEPAGGQAKQPEGRRAKEPAGG